MQFAIITGGVLNLGPAVNKVLSEADKVIAVDSGATHCIELKLIPDFVVGDFDSVDNKTLKSLEEKGSKILRFPKEKNETDTELAIDTAIKQGATKISVLGGISGTRIDHILSNILLLLKKKFAKVEIKFADGNQEIYLGRKHAVISGKKGDTISFIPISGKVPDVTSTGLKYNLANYHLSIQKNHGISNVLTQDTAVVTWKKGALLIVHTMLQKA